MLPALFRSSRALPRLSVAAVGLTMSSLTGLVAGQLSNSATDFSYMVLLTAPPTLAVGVAWAALLRWPRTVGRSQMRLGWLLSIPLAALNGGLTGALALMGDKGGLDNGLLGLGLGLTAGAIVWVPAMVVTLVLFGVPIAWSQRQARRGLLGAERGEVAVGAVCLLLSAFTLIVLASSPGAVWNTSSPYLAGERVVSALHDGQTGTIFLALVSALGLLAGGATTALATLRGRQRRRLIEAAESGARPDYRVEHTDAGRVLIRVRPASADDYRQADADEESFALEQELAGPSAMPGP